MVFQLWNIPWNTLMELIKEAISVGQSEEQLNRIVKELTLSLLGTVPGTPFERKFKGSLIAASSSLGEVWRLQEECTHHVKERFVGETGILVDGRENAEDQADEDDHKAEKGIGGFKGQFLINIKNTKQRERAQ